MEKNQNIIKIAKVHKKPEDKIRINHQNFRNSGKIIRKERHVLIKYSCSFQGNIMNKAVMHWKGS